MSLLDKIESFLERIVEGIFKRSFQEGMQPIEIGKVLVREMEEKRTISISKVYVPNFYKVRLSEADLERLFPIKGTLLAEMTEYLMGEAEKQGYSFTGKLSIIFESIKDGRMGKVSVESRFIEELMHEELESPQHFDDGEIDDAEDLESTIVVRADDREGPRLFVISGNDEGASFYIDKDSSALKIGRKETNHICIHDPNVSREHAVIERVSGELIIRDLGSKNGTYINDVRTEEDLLKDGDIICVGTTVMRFRA